MKYTEIFDSREQRVIGYEKRDDKDRLIFLNSYTDDKHEERIEHEYIDLDNGEWYKSKVTQYWIGEPMCNGRPDVEKQLTITYTSLFNTEIPTSIIIQEWDDKTCKLVIKEKYEFDIQSIENDKLSLVTCIDKVTKKHIIFTIDTQDNSIVKMTDDVNEIYTTIKKYNVGDSLETKYEMTIDETINGSGDDEEYTKTVICDYDNGLYERCFEYDRDNKFTGGYIRSYYAGGLMSYEYDIDKDGVVNQYRYFHYENGKLTYIHDGCGNKLYEYFEDDPVSKEYPMEHLGVIIDLPDDFRKQ